MSFLDFINFEKAEDTNDLVYIFEYSTDNSSRWFGYTIYGRPVYICYELGKLTVKVGEKESECFSSVIGKEVICLRNHYAVTRHLDYRVLRVILKSNGIEIPENLSAFSGRPYHTEVIRLCCDDLFELISKIEEEFFGGLN